MVPAPHSHHTLMGPGLGRSGAGTAQLYNEEPHHVLFFLLPWRGALLPKGELERGAPARHLLCVSGSDGCTMGTGRLGSTPRGSVAPHDVCVSGKRGTCSKGTQERAPGNTGLGPAGAGWEQVPGRELRIFSPLTHLHLLFPSAESFPTHSPGPGIRIRTASTFKGAHR